MKTNIIKQIGNITPNPNRDNPSRGRVYNTEYIAPTINTCQGGVIYNRLLLKGR